MQTNTQIKPRVKAKRVGIRKNLITYFTARFMQGLAFSVSFFLYMNLFGNNVISWWYLPAILPGCIVMITIVLEMLPFFVNNKKKG